MTQAVAQKARNTRYAAVGQGVGPQRATTKGRPRALRLSLRDDDFLERLCDLVDIAPNQYLYRLAQRHVQRQAKRRGWL